MIQGWQLIFVVCLYTRLCLVLEVFLIIFVWDLVLERESVSMACMSAWVTSETSVVVLATASLHVCFELGSGLFVSK